MRAALPSILVIAAGLAFLYVDVMILGDRQTLVSPPEAVVEGFVRQLSAGRFQQAAAALSDSLARRTQIPELRKHAEELERRAGGMEDVQGEPLEITGRRARAAAVLTGRGGRRTRVVYALVRVQGVWRIAAL